MYLKSILTIITLFLISACGNNNHRQFTGYVEGENIYLASPFYGTLEQLAVMRGQLVKRGQLLFSLDKNPQQITIASIEAELQQAKNTLDDIKKPRREPEISAIKAQIEQTEALIKLAQIRVNRFQQLYTKQASDKDSLDAAIATLQQQQELKSQYESNLALAQMGNRDDQIKAQENQVKALSEKLKEAQWELSQKTVYAPADGQIFDTYYEPGELVAPQQAVLSLLTPETIRIEFFVPVDYIDNLKLGQKIRFDCIGGKSGNEAVISYISPEVEYLPPVVFSRENSEKLVFRVKAQINDAFLFKPGQPVVVNV
ncbi:HlyD family secretion protein [Legionella waltersii]|uniref:Hemolysin D n=1 Tax=Legionella waltersii TaxID=66969 RepID=A0A0W1ADI4_9GAMM|nr:HlyD family efflux transporter periplasmic adaptor subunit [Legionella waltersii]KTD79391.1 hemolysin D [Legionella waltersii]SNU99622.1 hemolysin D [Legionella waltersii]